MTTLRKTSQDGKSITFADPSDHRNTLRVTSNRGIKRVGNQNLLNARNEIIGNFMIPVPGPVGPDAIVAEERVSVRISFSASTKNSAAVAVKIADMIAWLDVLQSDLLTGFIPLDATLPLTE